MLKIEEGKLYRARNGEKIGPMKVRGAVGNDYRWRTDDGHVWDADGFFLSSGAPHPFDLIAEWTDSPSVDLTKITTPFGLLDAETQKALREHPGPIEHYSGSKWTEASKPVWWEASTYRVRPQPPKPREYWLVPRSDGMAWHYDTRGAALNAWPENQIIHVVEKL